LVVSVNTDFMVFIFPGWMGLLYPLEKGILELSISKRQSICLIKYTVFSLFGKEDSHFWHKYSIASATPLLIMFVLPA